MDDKNMIIIAAIAVIAWAFYKSYEVKQLQTTAREPIRNEDAMSGEQQMWVGLAQTFSNPFGISF